MAIDYSKAYFKTWTNSAGWDMRLEIHLPNVNHVGVGTSDYVQLDESVLSLKNSKWSFKDNPVGTPDAPTLGIEFDFGNLPGDLQQALLTPVATVSADSSDDLAHLTSDGLLMAGKTRDVPATNVCYLFSDRGDKGGAPIATSLTSGGAGYSTASGVSTTTDGSGSGATADIVAIFNAVQSAVLQNQGTSGYTSTHTASTSGGSGSGCKLDITCAAGVVQTVNSITDGGSGYSMGDVLTITGGSGDATVEVNGLTGSGAITSYTLFASAAQGYKVGDKIYFSGGNGYGYVTVSSVTPQPRYVEFVGAQSPEFAGKISIDGNGNLNGRCEITFFDLVKTMLENTPMDWWCSAVYNNLWFNDLTIFGTKGQLPNGTTTVANTFLQYATVFYDLAYNDKTYSIYAIADDATHQSRNPSLTGVVMSFSACVGGVTQLLCKLLTNRWTRGTTVRGNTFTLTNTPITHIDLFKQDYSDVHKRGALLAETDVGFIASIIRSDKNGGANISTWPVTSTDRVSGLLEPDKNGETLRAGTMWDFINDVSKNFGCKFQWNYVSHDDGSGLYSIDINTRFTKLLDYGVSTGTTLENEFDRTEGDYYDYQPAFNVVSNHNSEVKNCLSEDKAQFSANNSSGKGKGRTSCQMVFHNHPSIWTNDTTKTPLGFVQPSGNEMKQRIQLTLRKLYYVAPLSVSDTYGNPLRESDTDKSKRVFKVHESITFHAGRLCGTDVDYKYYAQDDSGDTAADAGNPASLKLLTSVIDNKRFVDPGSLEQLEEYALGSAIARTYTRLYGSLLQSLITRTFQISGSLYPYAVGDAVKFLLPSGAPMPAHSGYVQGYLLACDVDWDRGTMKCDILTSGL